MRDTAARTERLKELFAQAMPLDAAARVAMLEHECAGDEGLRKAVADLLGDYDSAQQFFAQFPDNFARSALGLSTAPAVFSTGDLVAGRFRIVGFLGAGGMGEVYEAEDQLLDLEHVALKTLPAEISRDARAIDRLKRELALARKVTHPNVCRVFDVDQHVSPSGAVIAFFTMELLKGETLAARMQRTGPLSTTDAHPLVAQMAAALGSAHAAGVVHGDFKPGNVVLVPPAEGAARLVVTDFGLARRDTALQSAHTSGGAWGTPVYMAPEQFAGQRPTRATDVYALAAVVHELVTGKRPFERDGARSAALDPSWRAAIARGLEHTPSARFETVDELQRALTATPARSRRRWPLAAAIAVAAAALLIVSPVGQQLRAAVGRYWAGPIAPPQNVAVLPFAAANRTADGAALARGLSATLAAQLGAAAPYTPRLLFLPITPELANAAITPVQAHRGLGADLIVTGRIDETPAVTHITVELHQVSGQQAVLKESRQVEVTNGGPIVPPVRSEIAGMLGLGLVSSALSALDADGPSAAVGEHYVRGRGYLEQGRAPQIDVARLDLGIAAFQRTLALDSRHAPAHAALSEALVAKYEATKDTNRDTQLLDRAERSAAEASRLEPTVAPFNVARAQVSLATGRHALAIPALEEALRRDPGSVIARELLARSYEATSALELAERMLNDGVDAHPRYWSAHEDLGVFRLNRGQYGEAETHFLAGRTLAPDNPRVIRNLAALYMWTELFDAAEQELRRGIDVAPDPTLYNNLAWTYFYQEKFTEGLESLEKAAGLTNDDSVVLGNLSRAYRWVGQADRARAARDIAVLAARRQINADPSNVEARANLAYLFAEAGNYGEAGRLIARALDDAPGNVRVRFMSAIVFELSGGREAALTALKAAVTGGHPQYDVAHHPDLRTLRTDSRYFDLINQRR